MVHVDWDKGLAVELLALIAMEGGIKGMKAMRLVCKTWQQGFELSVTSIKVHFGNPYLHWMGDTALRFPAVTNLDLGECYAQGANIWRVHDFPILNSLILGAEGGPALFRSYDTVSRLSADRLLQPLYGLPLTSLDLRGCNNLTSGELGVNLQGMPLTHLDLRDCKWVLNEAGFQAISELPLTSLNLGGRCAVDERTDEERAAHHQRLAFYQMLTGYEDLKGEGPEYDEDPEDSGLGALDGLPLTALGLFDCNWVTDAGLEQLPCHRLNTFCLNSCSHWELSDAGLTHLGGMPLTHLELSRASWLTDIGLGALVGFSLTHLDLQGCRGISDAGLGQLTAMPLTRLNLEGCQGLSDDCVKHLRKMPLTSLDLQVTKLANYGSQRILSARNTSVMLN